MKNVDNQLHCVDKSVHNPVDNRARARLDSSEVMLAWPPKQLSPNARLHWAEKNRAIKRYRDDCTWLTRAAGLRIDWDGVIHAWITFYPPDRRHRDDDNMIASFKSGRDGVADALGIDDKRIRIHPVVSDDVVKGGAVKVRLTRGLDG